MNLLTRVIRELWGLFVDDGVLAAALVVWCALVRWLLPAVGAPTPVRAPILLMGCVLVLLSDVVMAAHRVRPSAGRNATASASPQK